MFDFILSFLGDLLFLLPWSNKRRDRRKEWSGTVESKRTMAISRHAYLVIFRTDNGQRKKLRLDLKEDFDRCEEGRRYTKKAGRDLPDAKPG
ncbi:MAG: hypothetical protein OEW18_05140 [Candidatus Aminicenantes bacterium]|nr:hypothetical protein [Candidatus Aminicenantes bacterium]